MFISSKTGVINKDSQKNSRTSKAKNWYWGINNNTNTHCYLLEMILDSLSNQQVKPYKKFIKNNITNLCLEVGNLSDFFEQLNYIIITNNSKSNKISYIMNLRDPSGNKFIDR